MNEILNENNTGCPCRGYNGNECNCHKNEYFCICQNHCKPTKLRKYNKRKIMK